MRIIILSVSAALLCCAVIVNAQRSTIPESLARAGTSLTGGTTIPSGPAPSMAQILSEVDLVVRGTVGAARSYLTSDHMDVLTDHKIEKPVILYSREMMTSEQPGKVPEITVTVRGGAVSINGLTYTSLVGALRPLESGADVLLLLTRQNNQYFIAGDFYGVFRVSNGRVTPLTKKRGFALEYSDESLATAERAILEQLRKLR